MTRLSRRVCVFGFVLITWCFAALAATQRSDDPAEAPATRGRTDTGTPAKPDSDHWAFRPIRRPTPPAVTHTERVRTAIDAFVLARLQGLGIEPSAEADRQTLIRRLSLDLLGLLPTPIEVDDFVSDPRPDAYERLVDRLLASPHFGERWGRHWLDLARYADSDGYEKDSPRPFAYLYRNWLIDAINRDLPFDQFTTEQLAGDLLPGATLDQKIATGFHRNTLTNREGGVDQEEFRNKANVDRVNTTSTIWLGLTMGCAECHNHKYDPLEQREYYGLFAFFNTTQESDLPAPQPVEQAAYETARQAFDEEHAKLTAALAQFEKEQLPGRRVEWEKNVKVPASRWVVLDPVSVASSGGATLVQQPDGSIQAAGKTPATDTYTFEVHTELTGITGFRLEVLPDPNHPAKGPGRVKHGNFVLSEFTVKLAAPSTEARSASEGDTNEASKDPSLALRATVKPELRAVPLQNATADFSQDKYPVAHSIDGNPATGWAVMPQLGQRHLAVFETKDNLNQASDAAQPNPSTRQLLNASTPQPLNPSPLTLLFTLDQQYGTEHTIGRLRISATTAPRPVRADDMPDEIAEVLRSSADQRTEAQKNALSAYHRSIDPEWTKLSAAVTEHAKKAPPAPATRAMTLAASANPPKTHVHMRGDFLRKGAEVEPGTPAILHPMQPRNGNPDRLDLAGWLVDPANPLTPRVTVNHIWMRLYGKGLVATPEDFGTRGSKPSHPELLDWLASELIARGWSRKELIKLIVTSATYRQSSRVRPELVERDPTNLLLARQNRYRLEAEAIRDLCLAASGLLAPAIGGPSVRPPQPAGVSDLTYAGSAKWVESTGPDRYRRGLYTFFQRTSPYPMLTTFDSPDGVNCTVRRERSNTPLQALTLLNDVAFVECAQGLAKRAITETQSADAAAGIRAAFRLCMAREPSDSELARLKQFQIDVAEACRNHPDTVAKLVGSAPVEGLEAAEAAAWVALARAILNLDEFVTRE